MLRNKVFLKVPGRTGAWPVEQVGSLAFHGAVPKVPAQDIPLPGPLLNLAEKVLRNGAALLVLAAVLAVVGAPATGAARAAAQDALPIENRNVGVSRGKATRLPRKVNDQALVNGWPLYRTPRGQAAFNHAMATLQATDGAAPAPDAFKGCARLKCKLSLPRIGAGGWIPAGRIWISAKEYLLIVHSPRRRRGSSYRRRSFRSMKYFVFHEFQNSTRNTDPFDTISAHAGSVFVPFYMGKTGTDARGRRYVIVVQVAPYDVRSVHASNKGSAGPGIEVAKNTSGSLQPLQGLAGALVATIIKTKAPHLRVVNHRGSEGRPMLRAYNSRLAAARSRPGAPSVVLPFVPAPRARVASATGALGDLIVRPGVSRSVRFAERAKVPPRAVISAPPRKPAPAVAMSPLAAYLSTNIVAMTQLPDFATFLPEDVAAIGGDSPGAGVVYLLDAGGQILGRIKAHREFGVVVAGKFVYLPSGRGARIGTLFDLDVSKPASVRLASLTRAAPSPEPRLIEPIRRATPPGSRTGG